MTWSVIYNPESTKMPAAPREKGKATKIAYALLGKPENLAAKKTARQKHIDEQLLYQATFRVR